MEFKDPEKLIDGISSITNIMKDLIKLASDHGIEQRLYCGDGIERIYDLLGDTRLTRWFADISEKSLSDEELWNYLLKFLEKEIRVQQQKMLHGFSADIKKSTSDKPPEKRIVEKKKAYHSGINSFNASSSNPIIQNICFICGESGHIATSGPNGSKLIQYFSCKTLHIATSGPNGSKLIQYFSCKTFVEMTPSQRFHKLKSMSYCYQCLFPGANQQTGKHKEGKCQ